MLRDQDRRGDGNPNWVKDFRKIEPLIRKWLKEYGEIWIGSENKRKTKTYKRMLKRYMEMSSSEITDHGMFSNFLIKSKG